MSQEELFRAFGIPALVCGAVLVAVFRPWRNGATAGGSWAGVNALAAGFVTAFLVAGDLSFRFPPSSRQSWEWLVLVGAAMAVAVGYGTTVGGRSKPAWAARILVAGLASYLIVGTRIDDFWVWRFVTAALMVASVMSLERFSERVGSPMLALTLCLATAAASYVLLKSRNETLGHMAGAIAACLAVAAGLSWWRPSVVLGSGGILFAGVIVPGLVMSGHFSGRGIPTWCFLVAAIAPVAFWLTELQAAQKYVARKPQMIRAAAVVLTAGVAAAGAWIASGR